MNFFGNRQSSNQHSRSSISFSLGMPSLPTSSQQKQAEASSTTPSTPRTTLIRETSSTPHDHQSQGRSSQEIELVTPQSSMSVVKTKILPEFSNDNESDDDDSFEDVEFGGAATPTTTTNGCGDAVEHETNQRATRKRIAPQQWIPTNIVHFGLCIGFVTFVAVAVFVVINLTTRSSPATATTTMTSTTNTIAAATGNTFHHNRTVDSVWMTPQGNSTRRALLHLYPKL
jgi:hypothetical protein